MKTLFIDNFDSFTYNVVHLLRTCGTDVDVFLNDDSRLTPALLADVDALVVGPGPGNPGGAAGAMRMLQAARERGVATLGVCLGLQAIAQCFGARIVHAPQLMHGKTSRIAHDGSGLFEGVPKTFVATRYHSLCIDERSLPAQLQITARSDDGVIQAIAHEQLPFYGVQFHPESVLSEHGPQIAKNFLRIVQSHE